ncbi:hypothetical protein FNV43_RR02523 [Rhamnella rubrinervis]|uniref:RRM domain-containing protein n=1 Tax=Rhamnella rubrinervis TaxID=2594499 RepID=A0A8K0HT51_9ROSA|nr:hypothetical protein FNV43_RR02523 [Rhamnella rubrinervis]
MTTCSRLQENYGKSSRLSLHDHDEGSSARTRPFSFEEIMLRRKNKNASEYVEEEAPKAESLSRENIIENVSHGFESGKGYGHHKDSFPNAEKHLSEEPAKVISRNQEKNISINTNSEHDFGRGKDRGSHEIEIKLKSRLRSIVNNAKEDINDKQTHGRRNSGGVSRNEEKNTSRSAKYEDDFSKGKNRGSSELDRNLKARVHKMDSKVRGKNDKETYGRGKYDKLSGKRIPNEPEKRPSRDLSVKERHADQSKGNSEREKKRKYENGDDEKMKDRNSSKKHDPGRHYDLDISERKDRKELSKPRVEEARMKRKRSRSRDHEDRNRRSTSPSSRANKHTSSQRGGRGEHSSHSLKDRSGRLHSDVNGSKVSNNGSSSHYQRNDESESGLGGYSPRKRRTDSAAKTTSPASHSPEKKSAKWDLPPAGTDNTLSALVPSNFESSNNTVSSSAHELAHAVPVTSTTLKSISWTSASALSTKKFASFDSVQLTQATRPMRRLYIENVPSSTSEKALVEYLNSLLLSSGVNHIQGTQPCISCIINKEKGHALVEFLTPEDASAALSFDSSSISGSILKIRRPKDFVEVAVKHMLFVLDALLKRSSKPYNEPVILSDSELFDKFMVLGCFGPPHCSPFPMPFLTVMKLTPNMTIFSFLRYIVVTIHVAGFQTVAIFMQTGDSEKSMTAADTISNVVKDSPNKVFIGGIAKTLSSKMLLEIVSAFGLLKAYHFEVNEDLHEPCAFLEYVDQSVTLKACAGLNGMKLGGKVLTVLQAVHGASSVENTEGSSLYKIPEHAKPLLKQPTQIIKLKNVFNVEDLASLSEPEIVDIVEDIRLECARFGTLKSINVVKKESSQITATGASEIIKNAETVGLGQNLGCDNKKVEMETDEVSGSGTVEIPRNVELEDKKVAIGDDDKDAADNLEEDCSCQTGLDSDVPVEVLGRENISKVSKEFRNQPNNPKEPSESAGDKVADTILTDDVGTGNKLMSEEQPLPFEEVDSRKQDSSGGLDGNVGRESQAMEKGDDMKEHDCDLGSIFEVGCVFVEFGRTEASCIAAHCLHGRLYDDRIVTVEYIALDHYRKRFPK